MAVPDFQTLMLPILKACKEETPCSVVQIREQVSRSFNLTSEDLAQRLPSGVMATYANRIAWGLAHLKMGGLLVSERRGFYRITASGLSVLKNPPVKIDLSFLRTLPVYRTWEDDYAKRGQGRESTGLEDGNGSLCLETPKERIDQAYQEMRRSLVSEVLEQIKACSPAFFEQLVVDVIVKMGYGGLRADAGLVTGRSGDGGIDGVIKEDKLGLDNIYVQAKRWESTVGRPEIQKFVGALTGARAKKGLFITTSDFSAEAKSFVQSIEMRVVLIDGKMLAQLMVDYNVGVATYDTYEFKRMDSDYFSEGE